MLDFFSILESNNQKYKTNETIIYENYKGKFIFNMSDFLSFVTDHQPMFYMPTRFLKGNIDGVRVPKFELA